MIRGLLKALGGEKKETTQTEHEVQNGWMDTRREIVNEP